MKTKSVQISLTQEDMDVFIRALDLLSKTDSLSASAALLWALDLRELRSARFAETIP